MSEAPSCCGHPMDVNMGGWTCMQCGRHVRPYDDGPDPEPELPDEPDAYATPPAEFIP